jgi:hypothetical protein
MAPTSGNHTGMEIDEATISEAGRCLVGASPAGTRVILHKGRGWQAQRP